MEVPAPSLALATAVARPPAGAGWVHEVKFDGYRLAATIERGATRLTTRNRLDWTARFPEIVTALESLPVNRAVLDGEIVALKPDGRSDFSTLQRLLGGEAVDGRRSPEPSPKEEQRAEAGRLTYQLFDLLLLDGEDLRGLPLTERKAALAALLATPPAANSGGVLRCAEHLDDDGPAVLAAVCALGLEGIVSKRAASSYRPGRGHDWLKSVCLAAGDFLIGGFTAASGARQGFGALLLGERRQGGGLAYVGKVGTGFSDEQLRSLSSRLAPLAQDDSPFATAVPAPATRGGVTWVAPRLVAEVRYSERTGNGYLRQARFRGLREDKMSRSDSDNDSVRVLGVRLSSPERVVYSDQGVSKRDLAEYYAVVAEHLLRYGRRRPLSSVRCPEGSDSHCFYQKHPGAGFAANLPRVAIEEKEGTEDYVYLETASDLVALVQAGVLEVHVWGSTVDDLERPDQLVFDLDPAPDVAWSYTKATARDLRDLLAKLGLTGFLRTTGGKGLHVVVPLTPDADWDTAKAFAKGVAEALVAAAPDRLTTALRKSQRAGKLFIDYLRNGRGSTAITNYSTRARAGAPVATPLRWDELARLGSSTRYDIVGVRRRLAALTDDPWSGFDAARRSLAELLAAGEA